MQENEKLETPAQETPESSTVVRQSAEEFLKERIGSDFMVGIEETKANGLERFKTCELVEELKKREGVKEVWAEPHAQKEFSIDGPAIVLIVTD